MSSESGNPKVLAMVMCADVPIYREMAMAVKETWGGVGEDGVAMLYYWGNGKGGITVPDGDASLAGEDLILGVQESGEGKRMLAKTLMAYRYAVDHFKFDYVFKCCSGSYVVKSLLRSLASSKPKERLWSGRVFAQWDFPNQCVSGAGALMSKDVVQMIVDNGKSIASRPYPWEDLCVGTFLFDSGIRPDPAPLEDLSESPVPGCHHYHFRDRVDLMRGMHRMVIQEKGAAAGQRE